jgi:hypothetical protein
MGRISFSAVALIAGVLLGVISAMNALGSVGLKPVAPTSKWSEWQLSGASTTLVYSLGHFLGDGQLPPPKSARYFVRSLDEDGNSLRVDCVYVVEGKLTPARWWTMSVAPSGTASPKSELSAGEAALSQDNTLKVTISARPAPGNWIVPAAGGSLALHFIVNEPVLGQDVSLPAITKSGC